MRNGWPEVSLGDALEQIDRLEVVEGTKSYRLLGVRLGGRGAFHRETKLGEEVSAKKFNKVKAGDFIYSRLYAWKGAFSLIGSDLDGCYVSNEFPLFRVRQEKPLDLKFLNYWFRLPSVWRMVEDDCKGSTPTTRNRFNEKFFQRLLAPIPALEEQQWIVAHLDAIETRLARVQKLRDESAAESLALLRALMNEDHCKGIRSVPMHELVNWRKPDTIVSDEESYRFAGVYSFGRGVFRKGEVSGMDFAYSRLTRLQAGEFTYPKLMAWEGSLGIVPEDCDGCHVSPEFPVFTVDQSKVLPEILDIHFKTPAVWKKLADISTGTNLRRRRLNPKAFLGYEFPLPPMEAQEHIKRIANQAKAKQMEQDKVLGLEKALMPSLLDRVFNG